MHDERNQIVRGASDRSNTKLKFLFHSNVQIGAPTFDQKIIHLQLLSQLCPKAHSLNTNTTLGMEAANRAI